MTSEVTDAFLKNTTLSIDVINMIVNRIKPSTFDFGKVYKERKDDVWKFKLLKRTQHYVTLGAYIDPNLPHRSEYKRMIKYDAFGSEYITLYAKARLYAE